MNTKEQNPMYRLDKHPFLIELFTTEHENDKGQPYKIIAAKLAPNQLISVVENIIGKKNKTLMYSIPNIFDRLREIRGFATQNPEDTFDLDFGRRLAKQKLLYKIHDVINDELRHLRWKVSELEDKICLDRQNKMAKILDMKDKQFPQNRLDTEIKTPQNSKEEKILTLFNLI